MGQRWGECEAVELVGMLETVVETGDTLYTLE